MPATFRFLSGLLNDKNDGNLYEFAGPCMDFSVVPRGRLVASPTKENAKLVPFHALPPKSLPFGLHKCIPYEKILAFYSGACLILA